MRASARRLFAWLSCSPIPRHTTEKQATVTTANPKPTIWAGDRASAYTKRAIITVTAGYKEAATATTANGARLAATR